MAACDACLLLCDAVGEFPPTVRQAPVFVSPRLEIPLFGRARSFSGLTQCRGNLLAANSGYRFTNFGFIGI